MSAPHPCAPPARAPAASGAQQTSSVMVRGLMERAAELRFTAGGDAAFLVAVIHQDRGLPYLVAQRYGGDQVSIRAAQAKARLLGKGAEVIAYGSGLALDRHTLQPDGHCLRLEGDADLRPVALPARSEREATA